MFRLAQLRREVKPFRVHWFTRLRSTNDHAAVLRKRGDLFAPCMILAGHQIAGRGRGSNSWWSGDGSLTVTFVLPVEEHLAAHHVPLIAGLAVRSAAAAVTKNDRIAMKWPNDLLFEDRKLAGLLCERVDRVDLIGVGLNVNIDLKMVPSALRQRVTSLNLIAKTSVDMTTTLIAVARGLHQRLSNRDDSRFAEVIREYDQHHALTGRRVTVIHDGGEPATAGRCEGLDDTGRLLLRDGKMLHRVIAGHVEMK